MRAQLSQAEGGVGWLGLLPQSWKALGWPWYKTGECGVSDHNNELIQVIKIPVIHAGSKFSDVSSHGSMVGTVPKPCVLGTPWELLLRSMGSRVRGLQWLWHAG